MGGVFKHDLEVYRRLARTNSDAFEPDLATALSNVGIALMSLSRQEEALTSTSEAVGLCRRLADGIPTAFRPKLARALSAAAAVRVAGGVELLQALDAAEQSAAIYKDLAALHPAAFTDDLISALCTVADVQTASAGARSLPKPGTTPRPRAG